MEPATSSEWNGTSSRHHFADYDCTRTLLWAKPDQDRGRSFYYVGSAKILPEEISEQLIVNTRIRLGRIIHAA